MKKKTKRKLKRGLFITAAIIPAIAVGWKAVKNKLLPTEEFEKSPSSKKDKVTNGHMALS